MSFTFPHSGTVHKTPSVSVFSSFGLPYLICNWSAFDLFPQIEREPYFTRFWTNNIGNISLHLAGAQQMPVGIKYNTLKKD